jgi:hypothetical protein
VHSFRVPKNDNPVLHRNNVAERHSARIAGGHRVKFNVPLLPGCDVPQPLEEPTGLLRGYAHAQGGHAVYEIQFRDPLSGDIQRELHGVPIAGRQVPASGSTRPTTRCISVGWASFARTSRGVYSTSSTRTGVGARHDETRIGVREPMDATGLVLGPTANVGFGWGTRVTARGRAPISAFVVRVAADPHIADTAPVVSRTLGRHQVPQAD